MLLGRRRRIDETDGELVSRVRAGSDEAFAELYRRHRCAAAGTAAWLLRSGSEADDVVADAFAAVLQALRNGHGPREDFRAYLLACVRNACTRRRRPTVDLAMIEPDAVGVAVEDPERYVEADTVARAFASLSPRWQRVLWLAEVEDRTPSEIAAELGLAPNAVAALTYRAREGFATAYLAEHVNRAAHATCASLGRRLGAYVRGSAGVTDRAAVQAHLAECADCRRAVGELEDLNASLRSLEGPAAGAGAVAAATVSALPAAGGIAALAGSGLAVKVAAVVLAVVPTVMFGAHGMDVASTKVGASVVVTASAHAGSDGGAAATTAGDVGPPVATAVLDTVADPPATVPADTDVPVAPPEAGDAGDPVASGPVGTAADGEPAAIGVPPITAPVLGTPPVRLPSIETPAVSLPAIETPAVSLPAITVEVALPPVSVPPVSLPLPIPNVTVPVVTVPVVSLAIPSVTVPSVSVPSVTIPAVTLPSVSVPSVTIPAVTLPPITVPSITIPGLG